MISGCDDRKNSAQRPRGSPGEAEDDTNILPRPPTHCSRPDVMQSSTFPKAAQPENRVVNEYRDYSSRSLYPAEQTRKPESSGETNNRDRLRMLKLPPTPLKGKICSLTLSRRFIGWVSAPKCRRSRKGHFLSIMPSSGMCWPQKTAFILYFLIPEDGKTTFHGSGGPGALQQSERVA